VNKYSGISICESQSAKGTEAQRKEKIVLSVKFNWFHSLPKLNVEAVL
jgi:hypothetical protein